MVTVCKNSGKALVWKGCANNIPYRGSAVGSRVCDFVQAKSGLIQLPYKLAPIWHNSVD
jgi:hypothetical protein